MAQRNTVRVKSSWSPHEGGQGEVMTSDARFRVVACGRRWGKTEMAARETVRYLGDRDTLVWWVAPTYDETQRGFKAVKKAVPQRLIESVGRTWPKSIDLPNGSRIEFRSTDREDSNRGEGLDLIVIDEADDIRKAAWTQELRPSLSDTLGDMIAISTPMRRGWFYQWYERGQSVDYPDVESWRYPTAANPHIPDEEIESARREVPQRVFEQEYLAEFVDESGGVFNDLDDRLFTASFDYSQTDGIPHDGEPPYVHGWDLARHEDWTVGTVLDAHGTLVHYDRMRGLSWPQIQHRIESAHSAYEGTVAIDATRDNKLVSDLSDAGLSMLPVTFSPQQKTDLIENLVAAIENGELTAPEIQQLKHELQIFEYDVTPSGNTRYHAPEGMKDDSVDSLALANHALTNRVSVKRTRRRS